jgi:L-2-hydroxycarboxylate dehydrogenase (NAD+)
LTSIEAAAKKPIDPESLRAFVARVLGAVGVAEDEATKVARLMVTADLRGADGHGVFRLPQYVRRIRAGGINVRSQIKVVREAEATVLVDGDNAIGHLVVSFAADRAIEMANRGGVAWVGIRRGNHAGPGSLYAMMPLRSDQIGIYVAIGNANHMAPWGGVERLLSTNPIAIAIPCGDRAPLVLDMATSVVSYGTVKRYAKRGEPMPEGWMIDEQGEPLTDASRADEGLLLPAGDYKGYGLSLMITVLTGVLNGAAIGREVVDFNHDDVTPTNTGQAIAAIDVSRFCDVDEFKARVDAFIDELKASRTLPDVEEVRLPGERAHRTLEERSRAGIPLAEPLWGELEELGRTLGIRGLEAE